MAGCTIAALSRDPKLFEQFKLDPLAAIKVLEAECGSSASRLTASDVELIRSLSREEFEILYGLVDKMKSLKVPNFQL